MKNYLALFSIAAALYLGAAYTQPHEPAGKLLHAWLAEHCPCLTTEPLPAHGALAPHTITPQQARQPLQVVSPAAAGYTPEELSEIYPTH